MSCLQRGPTAAKRECGCAWFGLLACVNVLGVPSFRWISRSPKRVIQRRLQIEQLEPASEQKKRGAPLVLGRVGWLTPQYERGPPFLLFARRFQKKRGAPLVLGRVGWLTCERSFPFPTRREGVESLLGDWRSSARQNREGHPPIILERMSIFFRRICV